MASTRKSLQLFMVPLQAAVRQRIRALTLQAEEARSIRALDKVNAIADTLLAIAPVRLQSIARYYRAISLNRSGHGTPQSATIFESLTECSLPIIRARAELALGSQAVARGDHSKAYDHYKRAKVQFEMTTPDAIGLIQLNRMLAILKGIGGDHQTALFELQQTWKLAKSIKANLACELYSLINSLAIELSALGYDEQALTLADTAITSPYAAYHPEWLSTKTEILQGVYHSPSISIGGNANVLDFCGRRQAKLERLSWDQRCSLTDQIVHRSITRIVTNNDLAPRDIRRIIKILNK